MKKTEIIALLGYKGIEAKKAMLRTKSDLETELMMVNNIVDYTVNNTTVEEDIVMNNVDGFEVIAQAQKAQDSNVIVAAAPKATSPKAVQYVRLFPDGIKICQNRGLAVKKLEKDWKAFSDFVNSQATKLLNDAWKERNGKFTVLYKTMVVDPKDCKKWWALVTAKNITNKKQCTCLFEGVAAKREFTGNIEYLKF